METTYEEKPPTGALPAELMDEEPAKAPSLREEDMTATERANLAAFMNEERLKRFSRKCIDRYEADLASRADRMKRLKDIQKMYALVAEQKNFPFQKAANVKVPAITGPVLQISARLFDMTWPSTGRIFSVVPGTASDAQTAHTSEQFANSYVRYKMPYMAQGVQATTHRQCLYGSAFKRTYWNTYEHRAASDSVSLEDFVVAYSERSDDPSMANVHRYTMKLHMSLYDLEAYERDGIFVNVDRVKAKQAEDDQKSDFGQQTDKIGGVSPDGDDDDRPRQILEQHCRWKLPNEPGKHPAFDGKDHYIVVTLDAVSEEVLRISLREEDDPDDARRFERHLRRLEQYIAEKQQYEMLQQAQAQTVAMGIPAMGPPDVAMPVPGAMDTTMPGMEMNQAPTAPMVPEPQPMPEPPQEVPPPKPVRKRQICFFTHYRCFESDGFYGMGYGDILYGLALAMNTMLNQHIDGVTLKNAKPMFMSRQVRMQRGAVNVQPGEVVEIDGPVSSIRDAIMFLDPPQNDPTTVPLVKLLDAMKDTMVGSADLMSGQAPGSNQTKAGMQILNDQMMMPITVLARQTREAFRHELDKIWRCFGVFLEDEEIADVIAEGGESQQMTIGRAMFTPTARLVPASDPRMKSQRIEDHQQLFGYLMNNPLMQNPQIAMPIIMKLTQEGLRIFPDGEKLIPLLQPPAPPPPPPPRSQLEENAGFLQGQDSPVHPDDDDDQHIGETQMFLGSPEGQALDDGGRAMALKHLRGHMAQRMMKRGANLGAFGGLPGGPGGIGPGGLAGPPGVQAAGGAPPA